MPGSQQTLLVTGYRNRPKGILQKPALKALTVIWDHYYWFGFKKWRPSQISEDSQVSGCQLAKNEETHSPLPLTVDIKRDRQLFFIPSKSTHWWAPSVSREANQEQEPPLLEWESKLGMELVFIVLAAGSGQDSGPLEGTAHPVLSVCWWRGATDPGC